jgi:hypothetical protein
MVLNSCYCFYWDVEQDWDMPWLMQYGELETPLAQNISNMLE